MTERDFAHQIVRRLQEAGFTAYLAGGCVRDQLLGRAPADYDVATDATPEQVRPFFRRVFEVGASFGVLEVIGPRNADGKFLKVQVATFRTDGAYSDGRRPDRVTFCSDREDALRRDFTVNGMFFDPIRGRLIDYVGGQEDLAAGVLRAIGEPRERFAEDKLRMLRAARMATRFDFEIEPNTAAAIRAMAPQLPVVSAERVAEELRKLLAHPRRAHGMRLLEDLGLIPPIFPAPNDLLAEMKGLPQGRPDAPTGDLWDHVLRVLECLEGPRVPEPAPVSFPLAFAALLHDIGKKRCLGRTPDRYTFHGHEHAGKRMAAALCERLKLSNEERERTVWLVEKHQYLCDAPTMRLSKLKQVLIHPGIGELLALHRADSQASERSVEHVEFCESVLRKTPREVLDPPALISGNDLIARGLPAGPRFKQLLEMVREAQLEGTIHTREEALRVVETLPEGLAGG